MFDMIKNLFSRAKEATTEGIEELGAVADKAQALAEEGLDKAKELASNAGIDSMSDVVEKAQTLAHDGLDKAKETIA